jgi:hypothetical protein
MKTTPGTGRHDQRHPRCGGGDISILGKAGAITARGVSIGGTVSTSGSGAVTIAGIATGVSSGLAIGDTWFNPDADGTVSAGTARSP